jgi:hypothetical protein
MEGREKAGWEKILQFLRQEKVRVGDEKKCCLFLKGVAWILRTEAQWRDLPCDYGKWNSVYKRFERWRRMGVWPKILPHLPDGETEPSSAAADGAQPSDSPSPPTKSRHNRLG